ncbi:MAG: hypothetical protein JF612_05580, partial [Planctomycetia bacterium]|nr:hypothetical protein [Planctomycetia bacterium]
DLNRAIAAAEEDLAREQLAPVGQIIAGLIVRQKNVISETRRLDEPRDEGERTTAIQSSELKNVAADQHLLADETAQLKPQFAAAAVFSFVIEVAASNMQRAVEMLGRGETGVGTQGAERTGLLRLEQILAALGSDAATPNTDATTVEQTGQQPREENIGASTAEIKLVRLLQQTINERTAELEAMRVRSGDLSAGQQQELETLAREQGRLADMVLDWIKATGQGAEGTEVK